MKIKGYIPIITAFFFVFSFQSCQTLKYQEARYLEIDYDNMDKSREFWTEEERETYREAERRANIRERKEGSKEFKREGRYYTKVQSGSEINISERLFEYIEDNIEGYNDREFLGGIYKDEASIPKYPLAEDLIWAIMHSGASSSSWQDSQYKKICRYANRIKKDWREKGNASRIVPYRQQEQWLRCLNYHRSPFGDTRGSRYGYTRYLRFDSVKYIYRQTEQ